MEKEKELLSRHKRLCAPLLCVKRNVIELGPPQFQPKQGASYHPPSLPQLIFHFSSWAHRMRDVSISCQSFPGLCVTCVVISVWLTGSVVSHCPAASDSHRLTLMMSRGAARCVQGRQKITDDGGGGETQHMHDDQHFRMYYSVFVVTQWKYMRDYMPFYIYYNLPFN